MNSTAQQILRAAEVQRDYGIELVKLSHTQRDLIEAEQYSSLIEVLQHKQSILDRLHDPSTTNHQHLKQWPNIRKTLSLQERHSIEAILEDTERRFAELAQQEALCTQMLQTQRDQTAVQLKKLSQSNNARATYQSVLAPDTQSRIDFVQ